MYRYVAISIYVSHHQSTVKHLLACEARIPTEVQCYILCDNGGQRKDLKAHEDLPKKTHQHHDLRGTGRQPSTFGATQHTEQWPALRQTAYSTRRRDSRYERRRRGPKNKPPFHPNLLHQDLQITNRAPDIS